MESKSDCYDCPRGKYCATTGLSAPTGDCTAGYYCDGGSDSATQTDCPIGSYCPAGSGYDLDCPVGTYGDGTNKVDFSDTSDATHCQACPANNYCKLRGMTTSTIAAYTCGAGHVCTEGAIINTPESPEGDYCSAGSYCPSGNTGEVVCPVGYY